MNRTTDPWARMGNTAALTALVSAMLGTAAFAQFGGPPPGPPPGGPPFGGPRFGGPPPGGRRGPGGRPSTAADIPLSALTTGLKLTAAQRTKIAGIQAQAAQQRRDLLPRPGDGPPPDPEAWRSAMDKMRAMNRTAAAGIEAVLNASQQAALPALLKMLDDLRFAGIPPATYSALNLTDAQKTRITGLVQTAQRSRPAGRSGHDLLLSQAAAMLTPAQRDIVDKYKASHPRPPFGPPPPGGFGPPPPGGPGGFGPPPPDRQGAQDEDHGRPVALGARDLGVTPEQFRAAFRKVHPAGAGQEPTEVERRVNRKALSDGLGVSPERLDVVMDKYRPGGRGTNGPPQPPSDAPPPGGDE